MRAAQPESLGGDQGRQEMSWSPENHLPPGSVVIFLTERPRVQPSVMKGTPLLYASLLFHLSNESDDKWGEEMEGTGGWDTMVMPEAVIAPRVLPFTSKAAGSRCFLLL